MKNYVQNGDVVTVTAPAAVEAGAGVLVGSLFGVATSAAASGSPVEILVEGVVALSASGGAASVGDKAYFDSAAGAVTGAASGNKLIGVFVAPKAADALSATVRLNGVSV